MKDSYVSNLEEILAANEAQRGKIEFLERQSTKREEYLRDLEQNMRLNKQTLRILNINGPNQPGIDRLLRQNQLLHGALYSYYEQYQNINAMHLMEKQLRLEDRTFYQQRLIQFQTKINDLRKYLHDKEDSFSAVVARLKKYEDMGEYTMEQKAGKDGKQAWEFERVDTESIRILARQKNQLRQRCTQLQIQVNQLQLLKDAIQSRSNYQKISQTIKQINSIESQKAELQYLSLLHTKSSGDLPTEHTSHLNPKKSKSSAIKPPSSLRPNKELVKLLKKEKLNNQILDEALNQAIDKNEELITINQRLRKGMEQGENTIDRLKAENAILACRLAEYNRHYAKKTMFMDDLTLITHNRGQPDKKENSKSLNKVHLHQMSIDSTSIPAFINKKMYQYSQLSSNNKKSHSQATHLAAISSYNQDIAQLAPFLSRAQNSQDRSLMIKSASQPELIKQWQLDDQEDQMMIIQEY